MNKTFLDFLHRVHVQFMCKDMDGQRDDDRRLYLYCRLQTVADYAKAKVNVLNTAEMLNRSYLRDIANGEAWWRS